MRFDDLKDARVAILGVGREGQAVWRQLRSRFPEKTLYLFAETAGDDGFAQTLDPVLDHYHFGPLDTTSLKNFDVLVRSAGISPYRSELQQMDKESVRFTTASNLWFAENPQAKTIAISGTKGKSTTAALTAHLLRSADVSTCLAGNIGRPMLDCEADNVDWWVIELSSYQIADLKAEPDIVVLLNLSDEHIDWHGGAERYRADKMKLAGLTAKDRLIVNFADPVLAGELRGYPNTTWFNKTGSWQAAENCVYCRTDELAHREPSNDGFPEHHEKIISAPTSLPGEHNMHNLAAALTVVAELDLEIPDLDFTLSEFSGLPHRLQLIGENAGVRYVDDSISTTPVSVVAALNAYDCRDLVLLLGGMDRGLDWREFASCLVANPPHAVITMPDNGPKILSSLKWAGVLPKGGLHAVTDLSQAVALAKELVPPGGCVLLSPGAPSFPQFRDFEDRGNQFAVLAGIEKSTRSAH